MFKLDRSKLMENNRIVLGDWIEEDLQHLETALEELSRDVPEMTIVQHGRVIALRATDISRIFSSFKAALYLGKYDDMFNHERFLTKMVKSHHSYEPIRGEFVLFLYIGVGKPVYDHMVTYTVGRPTRIAGGQRANLPWGIEIPMEIKDREGYINRNMERVKHVINLTGKGDEKPEQREQLQAARSELPVGYVMPPFLLEFSEEALIKSVLRQRLWEQGAQGATVDVVNDMWNCLLEIDHEKWTFLEDYHGQHTVSWEKAMRTIRDKKITVGDFIFEAEKKFAELHSPLQITGKQGTGVSRAFENLTPEKVIENLQKALDKPVTVNEMPLIDILTQVYGKLPPTMWDKMNKEKGNGQ